MFKKNATVLKKQMYVQIFVSWLIDCLHASLPE